MNQRTSRILIVFSSLLLLLSKNLYFYWVKLAGLILTITLVIELFLFVFIMFLMIRMFWKMANQDSWRNMSNYIAVGIVTLVFLNFSFFGIRADENTFQSRVVQRACYEGTMNTSQIFFRENGSFEDFNIGWFGIVSYENGTWTKANDTINLEWSDGTPNILGEKIIAKDSLLFRINKDSLLPTHYYLGYCKGEN